MSFMNTETLTDSIIKAMIIDLERSQRYDIVRNYAGRCHRIVNHRYDDMPYADSHLSSTVEYAKKYAYILANVFPDNPREAIELAVLACWPHDTIEDTRQTFNDVKQTCGIQIAEIVYALTNEKGRTRKERANAKYYKGIRRTHLATFVKACDRLANINHSFAKAEYNKNGGMLGAYKKELPGFIESLKPTWFERLVNWYQWFTFRKSMFDGMELYRAMTPMFDEMKQMINH